MAQSNKKLVKSKSGYRMVFVDDKIASPFMMQEPQWIPDNACTHCQNFECQRKFDFLKRKHHCRRCGKCFCDTCCSQQIALPRMCFIDPVRHCGDCYDITKKENEFFDKHIRTLQSGGHFRLHNSDSNIMPIGAFKCQLSNDERFLEFVNVTGQENIALEKIESVQIAAAEIDLQGNHVGTGIAIRYANSVDNTVLLKMEVEENSDRKQSMSWVAAMQKAFKLIYESRTSNSA
ncbi:zinc finger FYVE domain-containing protein 21 [Aplysia californica]|uniref:Zinc finger FYVE domain-containing protein 21 n=1 Tax=Aplysia californica TaxID=6500 RepID=A0ABM0K328_APLCA|nr:zinc finger FYVE domain-containing protein 21 [Aplysia californica]